MPGKRKIIKSRALRHQTRYPHINVARSYSNEALMELANKGNLDCSAELARRSRKGKKTAPKKD